MKICVPPLNSIACLLGQVIQEFLAPRDNCHICLKGIQNSGSFPVIIYESARYKDYNLLMLLSLLSGALVILCSIIAQTINEQIDPRIRAEQAVRETEAQP